MEKRPDFADIKSYEEFAKYYWYREELQQICKQLGISSLGMKKELNHNIEEYFKGNIVKEPAKARKTKPTTTELTLETTLIECGFCFGPRFRDFFSKTTGIEHFKFNTDMVATVKKVKADNDTAFTIGDLLDIYYGRKSYATYDKSALQWNRFVSDFCSDPQTARFNNKLKTAALLWTEVRNSTREKIYTPDLLQEFAEKIEAES
ncbi:MAG: hypothetical protein J6Y82_09465 [Bacteroidales bacterium]|nr:hypothetical protein [Bacteroidales bacterium]